MGQTEKEIVMETEVIKVAAETTGLCFTGLPEVAATIVGAVIGVASIVANIVGKGSKLGKIINWLALNITVEKKDK